MSKMFAVVLFITGIDTAVGFNIYTKPENSLGNNDPLFGQTIIQSRDGCFVPSPTTGNVLKCTEHKCDMLSTAEVTKGLNPVVSIASNEDKEQLLVCNQFRTRNLSTEYFNGKCTHMHNALEKSQIQPANLVLQQLEKNETSNSQGSSRKRRAVQNNADTNEDEEDEDAGTEIAFVLDGSGSILPEDFETAKTFISTVMKNVWTTCFSCNFAIVQFGRDISTELSLQENNDTLRALDKVKNINQTGAITKTASALYHVLTEIFVPQHGSKENAKKMIILLSDGQMAGDTRTLSDVLTMDQMKGIVRYAIGVGPEVLDKPQAKKEMIEIAGSKRRFFNVTNYDALGEILDSLEKSIIGIEGLQKGAGFTFQLAEAGFSSHFTRDDSMLFGAVGAYDWSGGIILKKNDKDSVIFLNATKEEPRFSYLGYSVASAYTGSETLYISGAPRYNLAGAVYIFNKTGQDMLLGEQVGSYFGSVLCALDINDDKQTDYLLVGAPHFHVKGEEGKVLVYKLNKGKFEKEASELRGLENLMYARFGSAIADIGDIDGNKFNDVAVGAPLEADNTGSVYIFNGFEDRIEKSFSQRINPSDSGMKLTYFGQAVSVMSSSNTNQSPLISVGSKATITVFRTIPVIIIQPRITVEPDKIALDKQNNDESSKFKIFQICFNTPRGAIKSENDALPIEYQIDLDLGKEQKRLVLINSHEGRISFTLKPFQACTELDLKYVGCSDCFSPIKIRVNFTIAPSNGEPLRIHDAYSPKEAIKEIEFQKQCSSEHCRAVILLNDSKLRNKKLTIGSGQTLDIKFNLTNSGDNSYMTMLTLTYPEILSFKKSEGGLCENKNDNHQIVCKVSHPIFKQNEKNNVEISWQPINRYSEMTQASITAVLTNANNGNEVLDSKTYDFTVKHALNVQLIGTAQPNRLNIAEGDESKKQSLRFTFKLMGENTYDAKLNLTITIEKKAPNTELIIERVEPKSCSQPFVKNNGNTYQIVCIGIGLQQVNITAQTHIQDIQAENEKITATGKVDFDRSKYEGKDVKETHVEVSLVKLTVVKSTALIVGSSIGGFLLLLVIIIILNKCGFFRRRHKMERTPSKS